MTSLLRPFGAGVLSSALVGLWAAGAMAQTAATAQESEAPPAEPPPGYIISVEGSAVLERENTAGDAITGMPLLVGDRLRSEGGRLEIKWAERSELKLARYTELDVLSRGMVRVPRGKVTITLVAPPGQAVHDQLAIDAPGASVRFYAAGEYQIAVGGTEAPEVELAVIRGSAQLASDRGQTMLSAGERALVRDGSAPGGAETYDVATLGRDEIADDENADAASAGERTYDPTDDLAAFQRSSAGGAYQGTSYLPTELYGYEHVLGAYGSWESEPSYGHVWYPRVAADWRPYYRGRWHHVPRYGWTWLGAERWAYPTHHYGRWGFSTSGRWFWRPSRTWGSAWVSWAVAPSYVGWCPLGWDGRPVFGFYNFNTTVRVARGHDPWRGWTVIPSQRFGYRYEVPRYRVDHRVIVRERPAFITAWSSPRTPAGFSGGRGVVAARDPNYPRGRNYAPQRIEGSGPVPPHAGYSGYYPGGYRGSNTNGANDNVAVPREQRDDSPYERARRVMDRRSADTRRDDDGDVAGSRRSGVRTPGGNVSPGSNVDNDGVRGAYPRDGARGRRPQRDDSPDTGRGRDVSPSDNDGRRPPAAVPYRHVPGVSAPPSVDSPGRSRSRPSSDDGQPQRQYTPGRSTRPDAGRRGDDDGGRPSGGYAVPRHASPPPSADSPRERPSGPPSGTSAPRGGSYDRGGDNNGGGGRSADRGGSSDSGRSSGRSSDGGNAGSSDRGRSEGGGGGRRHPR